ncbi:MAG TPA: CDP-alcohol phosphatidyltransferase family protein [Gaiellaceae bacterium]|nr:CDP-alcohol phosphatidyltransferase family protein [Gaiellaceae bacterium]
MDQPPVIPEKRRAREAMNPEKPTVKSTRKQRPCFEVMSELVFRPLAHPVVLALLPLRVPPPAVVLAGTAVGLGAAFELGSGHLVAAAVLLQLKTLLDGADGQLARASGRVTVFGRYLDSESDLLVDATLFVALGYLTGEWLLAAIAFAVLTLVLSIDFGLENLYRRERGETRQARPAATGAAAVLGRIYDVVYAPQDRLVERFVAWRLRGAGAEARLAFHDRATIMIVANYGLSTQLAALGICLAAGHPTVYLWLVVACGASLVPLEVRRERRARDYHGGGSRSSAPGSANPISDVSGRSEHGRASGET